jgi:very-short-patch-repair endonuclease
LGEGLLDHTQDKGYSRPTARSRVLRRDATTAERQLWQAISARKLGGIRFNRQYPVGQYICDFVSREYRLVIEVDGGQHALATGYDENRTQFLEQQGYTVIRFWNSEVTESLEGVLARIQRVLVDMPSPDPSRRREGSLWTSARSHGGDSPC